MDGFHLAQPNINNVQQVQENEFKRHYDLKGVLMRDFLNIKKILIPTIIPIVFRLGLYFCIIAGIYVILFQLFGPKYLYQLPYISFKWFVLYPLIFRIVCEVLIILVRMNDSLTDIKGQLNSPQEEEDTQ